MKNVILETLRKGNDIHEFTSEIAEMMTAFIEWIGLEYGFHTLAIREIDMKWLHPLDLDEGKEYTINELFTYWFTEIYKKNQK